ncbi:MAG: N-acetylmuramoyl-L-alanine amidase [Phycisphaerae bacterium]
MSRVINIPLTASLCAALAGCVGPYGRPGEPLRRLGDEIVICGQFFHTGAPVVLWMDAGGYDAYRLERRFEPVQTRPSKPASDSPARYGSWRRNVPGDVLQEVQQGGWTVQRLREYVDQFVLHYDACGTSRRCFQVLHDVRGLSVHFMLDVDGTIYQTLDVKERAWHAGVANDRSVGVEIANIGAYSALRDLESWYERGADGRTRLRFPDSATPTGIRGGDALLRPARDGPIEGVIHGQHLFQYDFTDAQYESLAKLAATLCHVLPGIRPDYPRDASGHPRREALSEDELRGFSGLLGHYHITREKVDPGPAFDWERVLSGMRQ